MPRALLSRALLSLTLVALGLLVVLTRSGSSAVAGVAGAHATAPQGATAGTTTSSTGSTYAFTTLVGGKPVRWNPCAAIHWRANVSRAPLGGLTVLKEAVAAVAAATGTTWVYDGTSTALPDSSALPTTATQARPVLLGWTDGTASSLLRGQPTATLAMTRTSWFGVRTASGDVAATRGAVVALDRTDRLPLRGPVSWSAVALHELGHVMGLAHPVDRRVLMNATLPTTTGSLQAGDRTGLALVGRSQGCLQLPSL